MAPGNRSIAPVAALLLTLAAPLAATPAPEWRAAGAGVAVGDLDANGRRDCAIVLERVVDERLPRVFVVVFAEAGEGWRPLASVELDRGAVVERVRIATGRLTAAYRRHYPADPPGRPTNETVRSWAFVDGALFGGAAGVPLANWREPLAGHLPR